MSIEGDTSNFRAPVLNPDLIGEERNVYNKNESPLSSNSRYDM